MPDPRLLILILLGLILWFITFTGRAQVIGAKLNDAGKWCAILAYAALLWTWVR
jgi:hypothetical protein